MVSFLDDLNNAVFEPQSRDPSRVVPKSRSFLERLRVTELTELRHIGLMAVVAADKLERRKSRLGLKFKHLRRQLWF